MSALTNTETDKLSVMYEGDKERDAASKIRGFIFQDYVTLEGAMNMASSVIQIRVDEQLRNDAAELYERLGIDLPTAVRMFMKRSVMVNGIPFSMTLPKKKEDGSKVLMAMRAIQESAEKNGLSEMTLDEINAEIAEARR